MKVWQFLFPSLLIDKRIRADHFWVCFLHLHPVQGKLMFLYWLLHAFFNAFSILLYIILWLTLQLWAICHPHGRKLGFNNHGLLQSPKKKTWKLHFGSDLWLLIGFSKILFVCLFINYAILYSILSFSLSSSIWRIA